MNPEERKNLTRNYIANILDGGFFGCGIGFASWSTVIPLFVDRMSDSAILIGLISAVHVMGFQVPQLLMARSVSRLSRYKPMVMWMTVHERVPFLGLALIALLYHQIGPPGRGAGPDVYNADLAGPGSRLYRQRMAEYDQQSDPG